MTKIAIDVVLLPPDEIMDLAIGINKTNPNSNLQLNKKDNFPHITLLMAIAEEEKLAEIFEITKKSFLELPELNLIIKEIGFALRPNQTRSFQLQFEENENLQELHKKLIKELKHLLSYDIKDEMFFKEESEEIDEMSKYWVKTYEDKKEYHPHISLKCFEPSFDKEIFPIDFLASRIAICHLGRKGTCRKILFETELK